MCLWLVVTEYNGCQTRETAPAVNCADTAPLIPLQLLLLLLCSTHNKSMRLVIITSNTDDDMSWDEPTSMDI